MDRKNQASAPAHVEAALATATAGVSTASQSPSTGDQVSDPSSLTCAPPPLRKRCRYSSPPIAYRDRDYIQHLLDPRVFEGWLAGPLDTVALATTGNLDAPNVSPSGSMAACDDTFYDQSTVARGFDIRRRHELDALARQLIAGLDIGEA